MKMGLVIDTKIKGLGLEERKESYYIYNTSKNKENHIFAYLDNSSNHEDPTIEISKEFLLKLINYFITHKKELEKLNPPKQ